MQIRAARVCTRKRGCAGKLQSRPLPAAVSTETPSQFRCFSITLCRLRLWECSAATKKMVGGNCGGGNACRALEKVRTEMTGAPGEGVVWTCRELAQSFSRPTSRGLIINHTRCGALLFLAAVALGGSLGLRQVHVGQEGEAWIGGGGKPSRLGGSEAVSRSRRGDGVSSGKRGSTNSAPCAGLTYVQRVSRISVGICPPDSPALCWTPGTIQSVRQPEYRILSVSRDMPGSGTVQMALLRDPRCIPPTFPSWWWPETRPCPFICQTVHS